jgi:hypothetical protein
MAKISTLAPVVDGRGAGNVVRSFVLLTSILKQVIRILKAKNHTTPIAVSRKPDSNRRTIVLADIIAIVKNGGPKLHRKGNRLGNIERLNETHKSIRIGAWKPLR